MRIYGGHYLGDLFSLNYVGPSYDSIWRDSRKGVLFVPGEHADIFSSIASSYRDAKVVHGISGPIPIILAEDETKVRGRVSWEARSDTMLGFCRPKESHTCIPNYKPKVGDGHAGYNKLIESFKLDKVGGFARVIVIKSLHEKLPRLVLAARVVYCVVTDPALSQCHDKISMMTARHHDRPCRYRDGGGKWGNFTVTRGQPCWISDGHVS